MLRYLSNINKLELVLIVILLTQGIINLIGALGPELGFDALWYHLTLPKIYLSEGKIFFIPGGLLYYSAIPKLIEMLYIPSLALGSEIIAKLIHFSFGIITLFALYKLSRIFLSRALSLLVLVVFYSNLVVAWQSTTAYVDLGRTFFEVLALFFIVYYFKNRENSNLTKSAISIGLAISSKLLAFGSLVVFIAILFLKRVDAVKIFKLILISIIIPSPWFIFSYINTGNPVYPFFSGIYEVSSSVNISNILNFIRSPDPISPIYLITLPLVLLTYKKFDKLLKVIAIYSFLSFLIWFIAPQTGGGRFIMPYLPAFSILAVSAINYSKNNFIKKYLVALIILISISSIMYRAAANAKFIPILVGVESRHEFLSKNLNFDFGDFYDTDYYFAKNIKSSDKVLIYGTHNLFYVNFPFIHESWLKSDDKFNYIMVQNVELPRRFSDWKEIYSNERTHVKLYSKHERIN
ncbi:MAG: hypothetical protein A2868_03165 [Candidatus Levybacteria bacterium RIFCSPHIGHO2_01_FULL_40_15b]|nr:MAG: hypothetical protein A2868_03165 [Candidatus Levybacteria bacterium RIFCSPHIGHO2_01_FULL_40_15b]